MYAAIFQALLGIPLMLGIAYLFSANRRNIPWRTVFIGLGLPLLFAVLLLRTPGVRDVFRTVGRFFVQLLEFSQKGAAFVFGDLVKPESFGHIFAFQVLPTILFFSALTAVLFYMGVLQRIIRVLAWVMNRFMNLSGAESLSAAANVFIGQTEAPLLVKPYIRNMTRSELLCLMTVGMSTVAGGVLGAYVSFLGGDDATQRELFATHLLTASLMNAPAGIILSKMLFPEDNPDQLDRQLTVSGEKNGRNVLDALTLGVIDGLKLAVNVAAMLLAFIALVAMVDYIFREGIGEWTGLNAVIADATGGAYNGLSLSYLFGLVFSPFAWIMGVPSTDMMAVGQLLGTKLTLNEFLSYEALGKMKASLDSHSVLIATYALCGFANFSSIGIQVGGISALAPERRGDLSTLGLRALLGGTLACMLTATVAGIILAL